MVGSITPITIIVEITEGTTDQANTLTYTVTVDGSEVPVTGNTAFETTWTFSETTLSLSFSEKQSAFIFTGSAVTEVVIPTEHTHVTINSIETAVNLPALAATIEASDYINITATPPGVTMQVIFTEETFAFTFSTFDVSGDDKSSCGPYSLTDAAAAESDHCVPGQTTTIALPTDTTELTLFLHVPDLKTSFMLSDITTTFKSKSILFCVL